MPSPDDRGRFQTLFVRLRVETDRFVEAKRALSKTRVSSRRNAHLLFVCFVEAKRALVLKIVRDMCLMIFELRGATCNSARVVEREVDCCCRRGRRCCRRRCCSRCRRRRRACVVVVVVVGGVVIDVVSVLAWSNFAF